MTSDGVLLISTPPYRRDYRDRRQQPNLGAAFIGAYLRHRGIDCSIIDAHTFNYKAGEIIALAKEKAPLLIGVNASTEDRFGAISIVQALKQNLPESQIVAGGAHFSHSAVDALNVIPELDFVCRGDGELVAAELYEAIAGGGDFSKIDGLVFRQGKEVVKNPRRREYLDFNTLAPAWDLYDLDAYQGTLTLTDHTRSIGVISSRGCNNNCVFCANSLNRHVRYKAPDIFLDEVEQLVVEHGFKGINIQDDSFTSSFDHVKGICEGILHRGLAFKWYCSLRINEVDRSMLKLMKSAGCVGLGFGIESGSDTVLKNVRKGTNTGMILDVLDMVQDIGFPHLGLFVITSLPGETPDTLMESQEFLNTIYARVHPGWKRQPVLGSLAQIYPGTALEGLAKRNGTMAKDFSWNARYQNPKQKVFGTNSYVPHFENPGFPIEAIRRFVDENFPGMPIYIC